MGPENTNRKAPVRVLIVDDSAFNRQTIATLLTEAGLQIVGRAGDGEEALRLAFQLQPDVITLDLEMPRMDGFAFLRLIMARQPTPVIVISSNASKENVFKALELGALDFVAKPQRQISSDLLTIKDELIAKVQLVTQLRMVALTDRASAKMLNTTGQIPAITAKPTATTAMVTRVVAIGASTGGPPAITQILGSLDPTFPAAVLVTQHMPTKFTRAFAERLDRVTNFRVREAEAGDVLTLGTVLIAPGNGSLQLRRSSPTEPLRVDIIPGNSSNYTERFVPSVDRMLESAAQALGPNVLGVILTGMGGDGVRGAKAVREKGGRMIVESQETAIIFGMPGEAIASGAVDEILPLPKIADAILRFGRRQ